MFVAQFKGKKKKLTILGGKKSECIHSCSVSEILELLCLTKNTSHNILHLPYQPLF